MNENKWTAESLPEEPLVEPGEEPPEPILRVFVANEQTTLAVDEAQLQAAVRAVLDESPYATGSVSIAVVDDSAIHQINRQYLQHDYPTDVLSFVLEDQVPFLEGELVVSSDTASRSASEYGWPAASELLLYVIHGALHLVGYRDKQPKETEEMRAQEAKHLRKMGIDLPIGQTRWSGPGAAEKTSGKTSEEVPPT